jgi:hypothetical protein
MKNILITIATILAMANANSQISFKDIDEDPEHPFAQKVAIVDENGVTTFVENQDEDKMILGHGHDFYIVYRKSTNKIYVKNPKGVVLSGIEVPEGRYVEAVNYDNMTDHEQFDALTSKAAFTIVDPETEHRTVYNKHCKRIGGY